MLQAAFTLPAFKGIGGLRRHRVNKHVGIKIRQFKEPFAELLGIGCSFRNDHCGTWTVKAEACDRQRIVLCNDDFYAQEVFPGDRVHGAIRAMAADLGIIDFKDILFFVGHKGSIIRPTYAIGKRTLIVPRVTPLYPDISNALA